MIPQNRLDFLRGAAATYVVVNHTRGHFFIGGGELLAKAPTVANKLTIAALQATSLGAEAVVLFFVLSGFAMAHSVSASRTVGSFYLKRLVRIWPPYVAATLFASLVGLLVGVSVPLTAYVYVHASTKVTPQFWSLPYEVMFYVLCPLILASEKRIRLFGIVGVLGLVGTALLKGIALNPWRSFPLDFLGNEAVLFAAGALAYHHLERVPVVQGRKLGLTVIALLLAALGSKLAFGGSNAITSAIVVALSALLIRNLPDRIADFKPTNWGFFSYSIYLFHFALLALMGYAFRQAGVIPEEITNPVLWALLVPIVIAVCFGFYWFTERLSNKAVAALRSKRSGADKPVLRPIILDFRKATSRAESLNQNR